MLIGEQDFFEQIAQEVAIGGGRLSGTEADAGKLELTGDAHGGGDARFAFLDGAGEIEAAQERFDVIGVVFAQEFDEAADGFLDRVEFKREGEQRRPGTRAARQSQFVFADLPEPPEKQFALLVDRAPGVEAGALLVAERRTPDAGAFLVAGVREELREAAQEVELGEDEVDGRPQTEDVFDFVYPLTNLPGVNGEALRAVLQQFGKARGDQKAVDGCLGAIAFQELEEAHPLGPVFGFGGIAPGGVEQHAFAAEEPVAIHGAAHTPHGGSKLVAEREGQSGLQQRGAFSRRRVPDDHVPGQFVERGLSARLAQF